MPPWTSTGRPAGSPQSSTASVRPSGVRTVCCTLPPWPARGLCQHPVRGHACTGPGPSHGVHELISYCPREDGLPAGVTPARSFGSGPASAGGASSPPIAGAANWMPAGRRAASATIPPASPGGKLSNASHGRITCRATRSSSPSGSSRLIVSRSFESVPIEPARGNQELTHTVSSSAQLSGPSRGQSSVLLNAVPGP